MFTSAAEFVPPPIQRSLDSARAKPMGDLAVNHSPKKSSEAFFESEARADFGGLTKDATSEAQRRESLTD
jgi:hypothetical protein